MATDYISRDEVHVRIAKALADGLPYHRTIDEIPVADVVEVVRCKDCKYYKEGKLLGPTRFCYYYHIGTGLNTADDEFCSKGERRSDNGTEIQETI